MQIVFFAVILLVVIVVVCAVYLYLRGKYGSVFNLAEFLADPLNFLKGGS